MCGVRSPGFAVIATIVAVAARAARRAASDDIARRYQVGATVFLHGALYDALHDVLPGGRDRVLAERRRALLAELAEPHLAERTRRPPRVAA